MQKELCGLLYRRPPTRPLPLEHFHRPNTRSGTTCSEKLLPVAPLLPATISVSGQPPWHSASRPWPICRRRISQHEHQSPMPSLWPIIPVLTFSLPPTVQENPLPH